MREVAKRANTTTPTLYERFEDREALLWAVVAHVQSDVYGRVANADSLKQISEIIICYLGEFPGRLDLMNRYWPKIVISQWPKPVFELAKKKLIAEKKCSADTAEEVAYSLAALLFGTTILMRTAGQDSPISRKVQESSLKAVQVLCEK